MPVTLIKGTAHASLAVFDFELNESVKRLPEARHGDIISTPLLGGLSYITGHKGNPPPQVVTVSADQERGVVVTFLKNYDPVFTRTMVYPWVAEFNDEVIDFLLDGKVPVEDKA